MTERHSVRSYKSIPLNNEVAAAMREEIAECNKVSGLHIQLVTNESKAFDSFMAHYGKFSGVTNYIALKVSAKAGKGFYTKLDLGIVKYHFEVGAGTDRFEWDSIL